MRPRRYCIAFEADGVTVKSRMTLDLSAVGVEADDEFGASLAALGTGVPLGRQARMTAAVPCRY